MSSIGNKEPDLRADARYARAEAVEHERRAEIVRNLLEEVAGAPELKLLADHERRQRGRGHGSASNFW